MTSKKDALMASLMGEPAPAATTAPATAMFPSEDGGPEEDLFGSIPLNNGNDSKPPIMSNPLAIPPVAASDPLFADPLAPPPAAPPPMAPPPQQPPVVVPPPANTNPLVPDAAPTSLGGPVVPSGPSSLLASSGLLGTATTTQDTTAGFATAAPSSGGGGLFDEVDREEEEKRQKALEEERLRQLEEERLRQEQARLAEEQRQREEAERQRRLQEEQERQKQQQQQQQMLLQQQQQQQQQQQMNLMTNGMQSISLGNSMTMAPNQPYQQQQQQQQQQPAYMSPYQQQQPPMQQQQQPYASMQPNQGMTLHSSYMAASPNNNNHHMAASAAGSLASPHDSIGGFYRNHQETAPAKPPPSNAYSYATRGGAVQSHTFTPTTPNPMDGRLAQSTPSLTAGMHNRPLAGGAPSPYSPVKMASTPKLPPIQKPAPFESLYGNVSVSEPLMVQNPSLFNMVPPHWTYQVQTNLKQGGCYLVRRRFRHVVALEDRLRQECPGSILPGRPHKHATRALEETGALQSKEFADQRAAEMESYLNSLASHPYAGGSNALRLFLALQDDMGTAWPEVSSNALTRITAVTANKTNALTEKTVPAAMNHTHIANDALEDDAVLLALSGSEGLRMGAVVQAVPKLEGSITLMREHGECAGAVGMELSKLSKEVEATDRDLGVPIDVLSQGLLRYARRQKRLSVELGAALIPFVSQYKLCKNEKLAFADRRVALQRRLKERGRADQRAQRLMMQQHQLHSQGQLGQLERMERDASVSDEMANDAVHSCERVAQVLKDEVNRIAYERRSEWSKSMKVLASSLKESCSEQRAIWEATHESFLQAFPEFDVQNQKPPATM